MLLSFITLLFTSF